MNIDILALCDFAQDNDGKLTIVGTFDHYVVRKAPLPKSNLFMVARVKMNSEESKLQQEFSAEVTEMSTGKMILGQPINSKIEPRPSDEYLFSNFIFEFTDLQFPAEGNYQFSFKIGNVSTIATDCPIGGARMVIDNGVNGYLVPVRNKERMVTAMCSIAGDTGVQERFSKAGVRLRERLSVDSISKQWLSAIKEK